MDSSTNPFGNKYPWTLVKLKDDFILLSGNERYSVTNGKFYVDFIKNLERFLVFQISKRKQNGLFETLLYNDFADKLYTNLFQIMDLADIDKTSRKISI